MRDISHSQYVEDRHGGRTARFLKALYAQCVFILVDFNMFTMFFFRQATSA